MTVKVKICGVTNAEDAGSAAEFGADFIGFVFVGGASRCTNKETVKRIVSERLSGYEDKVVTVGLFKDEDLERAGEIVHYSGLGAVQFHGAESPECCERFKKIMAEKYDAREVKIIKAFKVSDSILPCGVYYPDDYETADYFVFDTFHPLLDGGTGMEFDHFVLKASVKNLSKPFFVAGGLNPENVGKIVKIVCPFGVDTSSGIEKSVGIKDKKLLKEFISNAKNA